MCPGCLPHAHTYIHRTLGLLGEDEKEAKTQGTLPTHAVGFWSLELSMGTGNCERVISALCWAMKGVLASDH